MQPGVRQGFGSVAGMLICWSGLLTNFAAYGSDCGSFGAYGEIVYANTFQKVHSLTDMPLKLNSNTAIAATAASAMSRNVLNTMKHFSRQVRRFQQPPRRLFEFVQLVNERKI